MASSRHSSFIDQMESEFNAEGSVPRLTGGEVERTRSEISLKGRTKSESLGLSPDDGDMDEGELDDAPEVGKAVIESIGISRRTILWRAVSGKPGVYEPNKIPSGNARNCLRKTDTRTGKRLFFLERELPKDWVSVHDVERSYVCADYITSCPKTLFSAEKLETHIRGFHPDEFETFKEELAELRSEETKARREARLAKSKPKTA